MLSLQCRRDEGWQHKRDRFNNHGRFRPDDWARSDAISRILVLPGDHTLKRDPQVGGLHQDIVHVGDVTHSSGYSSRRRWECNSWNGHDRDLISLGVTSDVVAT